jgi:hypothetical protein
VLLVLDGVPLAITLMAGAAEGQPELDGTWRRWQDERTQMLQRANATHRLLNIEVSYEISLQGPRMTAEGRRLLASSAPCRGEWHMVTLRPSFPTMGPGR